MSIESVMLSNHLILCHSLLLLPSIFPSIRVFSNESALRMRWPKDWRFSFNISPSNECCLVAKSCLTLATPWTVAPQDPLSTGFPRQAYWWPFPSPGDLPNPRVNTTSPALADGFFTTVPPGKPKSIVPQ